jgi:lipopolysaccharide/colanic/teichoic acid biosynthesis glycosyltransferase
VGAAPKGNFGLADRLLTRIIAAVVLTVASPLIGFIWIGLKLEHSGPAIELRKAEEGRPQIYSFVRGPGHVRRFVRQPNLQSLPSLWHLLNGDTVLKGPCQNRAAPFIKSAAKITDVM